MLLQMEKSILVRPMILNIDGFLQIMLIALIFIMLYRNMVGKIFSTLY